MALISLTWEIGRQPDCVQLFLKWAIMQGIAMLLQNRYQRQRLYTRIVLGKAKRMDVVWGETAGVDGQLWLLCPILFTLQMEYPFWALLLLCAYIRWHVALLDRLSISTGDLRQSSR
ncbi:uncharacterized protein LOC141663812 [Apium graveolens]|uniref:uncharacterized protein LOC141663812 n=1 Tax=Apium graveolens TaxID=4045 RepID=UPI003D7A6DAC